MLIVKVKICGITNYDDAMAAADLGADILGFNFYPKSPRYIPPKDAVKIIDRLPAFVDVAGVFVNAPFKQIRQIMEDCELSWVQLHGDEDPKFCQQFQALNVKIIKAIRVKSRADIDTAEIFSTDAVLLDAFDPKKYGGTGLSFDWNIVGHIATRVFLAGGINPDNAVKAIQLGVYGIDICSGIESAPGKKDHKKMKKLFENIGHLRA
jgi:phosphoribosylanthranilate isomerase